ncbi:GPI transamidase component PIG-S [Purpureocillium lavendulum]|uniref:GPI transamidase component PIG-S n=1 Tax=Purpureocillium lavendulum TaxID=1247861 RepID=A0AB34FD37_9HYPO|nr:GPI transamidase component PIG-S [Purpureocillium lavendulum]
MNGHAGQSTHDLDSTTSFTLAPALSRCAAPATRPGAPTPARLPPATDDSLHVAIEPLAPLVPVEATMASDSSAGVAAAVAPSPSPSTSSASATAAPGAPKQPPPEKPSETRRRSYIVLSFWLIVLVLGLPIWWKTTTIYRADLPFDRMLQWADGKACRPVFPLRISVRADALPEKEAQHLVQLTQHAIDDLNDFSGHHLRLQLDPRRDAGAGVETTAAGDGANQDPALTIRLAPGDATSAVLNPQAPVLDMTYVPKEVPSVNAASSALASYIADQLQKTFDEEKTIISYLLSTSAMSSGTRRQALSAEDADALAKRTTKSLRYAPTYHLTFSLFTDGAVPSSWDVDRALDDYLRPMLDVLRPIHNFTIDTQVQLYATPGVQSQVLGKEHLASFINAAEWPLSPSIGNAPTVNFVVFVGNQTIGIDSGAETSQSWMIPQWGTVYLLSLPPTATHVSAETLRQPMLTFGGHLLSLLGTPRSGSLPLRLSTLARIRSTDLLLRAASSLGSLARLARALPSIAIPRSVADGVSKSMHHLEQACASLGGPEGLLHARIAEEEAERAFFEKSMVGQLYFPDEHKIAVYLPLLGPVGVPLVLGLINELKNWIRRRKQKAAEARDKKAQ